MGLGRPTRCAIIGGGRLLFRIRRGVVGLEYGNLLGEVGEADVERGGEFLVVVGGDFDLGAADDEGWFGVGRGGIDGGRSSETESWSRSEQRGRMGRT